MYATCTYLYKGVPLRELFLFWRGLACIKYAGTGAGRDRRTPCMKVCSSERI